jgi:hypothetical protein
MDARLGAQVERILHFVEGRWDATFAQPFVDEPQKLILFACQHVGLIPKSRSLRPKTGIESPLSCAGHPPADTHIERGDRSKQIMNGHYMFDMCSATS